MQRPSRLKGGHRVGINPNSTSGLMYQPDGSHNQQVSADHHWNYQQSSWSKPNAYHGHSDYATNENVQDTSWNWDTTTEGSYSTSNQSSLQGASANYNQINASSHVPKDMASPQFTLGNRALPHVTQNRALSHVVQKSSPSHGTYSNTSSNNQAIYLTSHCANNFTASVNSQNTSSQNQSSDEWGWNNDNWDDWCNGEGKPIVSTNCNTFNNSSVTTSLSQNSTATSGINVQEYSQTLDQVQNSKPLQHDQQTFQMPGYYTDDSLAQTECERIEERNVVHYQNDNYQLTANEGYSENQTVENKNSKLYTEQFEQLHTCRNNEILENNFNEAEVKAKPVVLYEHNNEGIRNNEDVNKASNLEICNSGDNILYPSEVISSHDLQLSSNNYFTNTPQYESSHTDNQSFDHLSSKVDWKWNDEDLNTMNKANKDLSYMIDRLTLEPSKDRNLNEKPDNQYALISDPIENLELESCQPNLSKHFDSQNNHYTEAISDCPENFEINYNSDYSLANVHESEQSIYCNENQIINNSQLDSGIQSNLLHDEAAEKTLLHLQSAVAIASGVAEWDDEWNNGWDKPRDLEMEASEPCQQYRNNDSLQSKLTENSDEFSRLIPSTEDKVVVTSSCNLPEVKNIHTLNQELHGIFRSPSDNNMLLKNYVTNDEINENKSSFPYDHSHITLKESYSSNDNVFDCENDCFELDEQEGKDDVPVESTESKKENLQHFADNLPTPNIEDECNCDTQPHAAGYGEDVVEVNDVVNKCEIRPHSNQSSTDTSRSSQPPSFSLGLGLKQSQELSLSSSNTSSRSHSFSNFPSLMQPTIPSPIGNEMISENLHISSGPLASSSITLSTEPEGTSLLTEQCLPTVSPHLAAPIGNISQFHARKGSPFQPPASKKKFSPQHSIKSPANFSHSLSDSLQQLSDSTNYYSHQDITTSTNTFIENSLIANSNPPEQIVKLSVVSVDTDSSVHMHQEPPAKSEIVPNSVPVVIPSNKNFFGLDEISNENFSGYDNAALQPSNHYVPHQQFVPPPAHLSNLQPNVYQPKVQKLNMIENTSMSPGILDLTQIVVKLEKTAIERESDVPSFSRMVPGESKKGESNATVSYHPPTVVPEMPSERVVTGNAYPQPIPTSRIKQEPNEIRLPPDGPDTADRRNDQTSSVVPPIRSETIGSEDMVVRPHPNDRRDDRSSDGRRDRNSWDRDPYEDRHNQERRREGRDRYMDESSYGRHQYDRDYDSRQYHRRDTDEEDDDDHQRYAERKKERRNRGYRDELDRYNDKDRDYRRLRRRDYHLSHEEEDPYYEGRSDRSRPSSRSSSYANLVGDNCQGDFYDSSQRGRKDISRGRDGKERDRSHREVEPPYRDSRMKGSRDTYMGGYPYPEHYGSRGMYDPQSYYYYYQNYYRDYYRRLYGSSAAYGCPPGGDFTLDDKASTRSGRSSVNDEMKKSSVSSMAPYEPYRVFEDQTRPYMPSSHFRQDFIDQSSTLGGFEPSAIYPEHEPYSQLQPYVSGDISGVPSVTDEGGSDLQQRLSPLLFNGPHLSASFTSGGKLLLVVPNDPKQGEKPRVQIRNVQKMLDSDKDLAARIQKMKVYPGPLTVTDTHKDVVISFCNQKVDEALKNKNIIDQDSVILFWEYLALLVKQNGKVCGADLASLLLKGREVNFGCEAHTSFSHHERSEADLKISGMSPSECNDVTEASHQTNQLGCVKRFTELLCLGRKKEAVDYAIKEGLWGYAMTLAAKMDLATHTATSTRVMSAFIQSIPKTHVLQTLFQHLSGKRPEVSKNYIEERWGDWRLHLAMIVSNPTGQLHRDRASIFTFGDTLAAKNRLHAAHLCYLAGDAEWGTFSCKESKLVLLGANHHLPFQIFANDDSIQCTEIFEYAMALDSSNKMMVNFQSYKLVYALRLAEAGFSNEALKYCEVICQAIVKNLGVYQTEFVSRVLDLATQLKYHDVHYQMGEGEAREMPDPVWLQHLQNALYTLQYQAAHHQELADASSEQVVKEEQHTYECTTVTQEPSYPTYNTETPSQTNIHSSITNPNVSLGFSSNECDNHSGKIYSENSYYSDGNIIQEANTEVPMISTQNEPCEEKVQVSMPYDVSLTGDGDSNNVPMLNNSAPPSMAYYGTTDNTQSGWNQQQQQQWQANQEQFHNWQPNQQQPQSWQHESYSQYSATNSAQNSTDVIDSGSSNLVSHNSVRDAEEEQYWAMMSQKGGTTDAIAPSTDPKELKPSEDEVKKKKEESPKATGSDDKLDDKKSSGIFGSLFGWRKANNNQAKLPDDKNPSIVWDDQKNKWVDVDGDEADEAVPPPPPSSLAAPPNLASFRGGLKKSRYVDPVGDKGRTKTTASPLLPSISNSAPLQSGPVNQMEPANFMPLPSDNQPQLNLGPRNEIQGASGDSMGPIPMMGPPETQQPMFFNPSQMKSTPASNQMKRAGPSRRVFNTPR